MAFMLAHFEVGDYDAWKEGFDSDPVGRKDTAKGHQVMQSVEDPSKVFVGLEFDSVDDAKAFREKLLGSDVLDRVTVKTEPTVVEVVDRTTY